MQSFSLAAASSLATPPDDSELSETRYLAEVLHLTARQTEDDVVDELIARAEALGIATVTRPSTPERPNMSSANSATTGHARNSSTDSNASTSTAPTTPSSTHESPPADMAGLAVIRRKSKTLSFTQYDKYLTLVDRNLKQPKFAHQPPPEPDVAPSIFSVSTRKSYRSIKRSLGGKVPWKKKKPPPPLPVGAPKSVPAGPISPTHICADEGGSSSSCVCCREEFSKAAQALQTLPCGHTYCENCLRIMVNQSRTDESKMPPRCCTQPIPGFTIKAILPREEQFAFLKSVLQFSTPWEARIFCPNSACLEFIPPRSKIDPKHPFEVVCRKCKARVCIMCKRNAHRLGQDCPDDWELEAVLKMGEKSGWRRCYKCRTLVELSQGCTHMTCRCKAQFCYICGAVWDNMIGCPNFCNGEEEMERRRVEEETRVAELAAQKEAQERAAAAAEAERIEAEKRTAESAEFKFLRLDQLQEMDRFGMFERKTKWIQWSRHAQKKLALVDRYTDQVEKMKERHAKTAQHLEDRQITAEMDFRATLEQGERSVRIRLKHMEAYCDGLGRAPDGGMPQRVVTERDLRELGQQYNLRDGMARLHQARINVMRDQQAKRMEELLERQEAELQKLMDKRDEDLEDLAAEFAHDEDALSRVFLDRKAKLQRRWELAIEILRKEMEARDGVGYGPMALPEWPPDGDERHADRLPPVDE